MAFILLILFAVFAYVRGYKITALVVFFFFATTGFNLIPEEYTTLTEGFSKATDFGIVLLALLLVLDLIFIKGFIRKDTFSLILIALFGFLVVCAFYNRYVVGIGWGEIIRTIRYLFFWLAFYTFRSMSKESLESLLKVLFVITVFTSILFLLQLVIDDLILVGEMVSTASFMGMEFKRFYNQPEMLHFFVFYSLFKNPFKGVLKFVTIGILVVALLAAFHRNLVIFFVFALFVGYFVMQSKVIQLRITMVGATVLLLAVLFILPGMSKSRTFIDIKSVLTTKSITEMDINFQDLQNATFSFRVAHLLERNLYLQENPKSMLFGAALLAEDSRRVEKMFDFKVGVVEEITSEVVQLDTGDISYSFLLLRYGYLGTFLNLLPFFYMLFFFYKKRKNTYAYLSFMYLVMSFGTSFFASNLIIPTTFLMPVISMLIVQKSEETNE